MYLYEWSKKLQAARVYPYEPQTRSVGREKLAMMIRS